MEQDSHECPLTWSGGPTDQSIRASAEALFWQPDAQVELRAEQGLPVQPGWPVATRLQLRAAQASPAVQGGLHAVASLQGGCLALCFLPCPLPVYRHP